MPCVLRRPLPSRTAIIPPTIIATHVTQTDAKFRYTGNGAYKEARAGKTISHNMFRNSWHRLMPCAALSLCSRHSLISSVGARPSKVLKGYSTWWNETS
jgi:hypothetical protein